MSVSDLVQVAKTFVVKINRELDLKYLLGKSPHGETIDEHLARIRDIEMDLACYVKAIDRGRKVP